LQDQTKQLEKELSTQTKQINELRKQVHMSQHTLERLKEEDFQLRNKLNQNTHEEQKLTTQIATLSEDISTIDQRLLKIRSELFKLEEDPRAHIRKAIATALQALPKDLVERS
jgi:chromosome segregation ATPase